MKKYDVDALTYGKPVVSESDNGQWVPAEVAQALYDALFDMVHPLRKGPESVDKAIAALSKADKE